MARQRRRVTGQAYEKRQLRAAAPPSAPAPDALNGAEAHELASRIESTQRRYQVRSIRLLGDRRCGVIVADLNDGSEHTLQTIHDWERLRLS